MNLIQWIDLRELNLEGDYFKRSCLPDGSKVGLVAVSPRGDLRMPTDACVSAWLKELE